MRGRYIVIEGIDGCGKGEQTKRLRQHLRQIGHDTSSMYEPGGGSDMAFKIRVLLKESGLDRHPLTNVMLFNAARVEALSTIKQFVEDGIWVISDRNRISTFAYQGHGEGVDLKVLYLIDDLVHGIVGLKPDLEIMLDVPLEVARERRKERGTTDYFEELGPEFEQKVFDGYRAEAGRMGLTVVDGRALPGMVFEMLWQTIGPLVSEAK